MSALAATRMVEGDMLRTTWGRSVTVAPHTVNAPGDGFVVMYRTTHLGDDHHAAERDTTAGDASHYGDHVR